MASAGETSSLRAPGIPVRSLFVLVVVPIALILYSAAAIVRSAFGQSPAQVQSVYAGFARLCVRAAGTRVIAHGAEHVDPNAEYVVVSNHVSQWDPACILSTLPALVIRFVVKDALMRIPVFGRALERTGNVRVERTGQPGDVDRIRERMARREPGVSMLFFAEGARARDGRVHEFKMGAFATAIAARLPILPVAVAGTDRIWQHGSLIVRRGTAAIEIGQPIPTEGLDFESRAKLRDRAHAAVLALHERALSRLGE